MREPLLKSKPNRMPISDAKDERLAWLTGDFLKWLDDWRASIRVMAKDNNEAKKMFISEETYIGLRMTAFSMREICENLVNSGFRPVYTANFNQDYLEGNFSVQRAQGRRFDNPTVYQYGITDNIIRNLRVFVAGSGNSKPAYFTEEKPVCRK